MGNPILVNAIIKFYNSKLEAVMLLKSDPMGAPLTLAYLQSVLAKHSIINGVDQVALTRLAEQPDFSTPITIAKGTKSVTGDDAKLEYQFNLHKNLTLNLNPDGTVDFKNLGLIQTVSKGDVLVVKTPATHGMPGVDVCGQTIVPKAGKDIAIPTGRNVVLSPDKLQLFADVDGQVDYVNDRVSVFDTYRVDGDVSVATGNIEFNGNVFVKGNIQTGFYVKASGNVEVNGAVEMATVLAGGDIIIRNGFNGGAKGLLRADGNITSKFIQAGSVVVGGKLETTYIYNSSVRSGDTIHVVGKGVVVGGRLTARTRIDANVLGNDSLTTTIVEVGSDPDTLKRYREIPDELAANEKTMKSVEMAIDLLGQLQALGRLTPEKEVQLEKSKATLAQLISIQAQLTAEKESIDERVASFGKGFVAIHGVAHPGVQIVMGSEQMNLKSRYEHTMFSRQDGYIRSGPL